MTQIAPSTGKSKINQYVDEFAGWTPARGRVWTPPDDATTAYCVRVAVGDRRVAFFESLETLRDRHLVIACLSIHHDVAAHARAVAGACSQILDEYREHGNTRPGTFVNWTTANQKIAFRCAARVLRLDPVTATEIEIRSRYDWFTAPRPTRPHVPRPA